MRERRYRFGRALDNSPGRNGWRAYAARGDWRGKPADSLFDHGDDLRPKIHTEYMSGIATSAATAAIQAHSPGKAAEGRVSWRPFGQRKKERVELPRAGRSKTKGRSPRAAF